MIRRALPLALLLLLAVPRAAGGDPGRPPLLDQVGLDARPGARLPLDLVFTDTAGRRVTLAALFADRKPVLMVLAYVRCRMLCSLVLRGAVDAVRAMPLEPGADYRIVTVSIDPEEEAASAAARRRQLVAEVGRPGAERAWTYLVGAERPIRRLAASLGFRYAWDPKSEQYAHPAVLFVLTPDGRLSRAFEGIQVDPSELAGALRAAAGGAVWHGALAEAVLSCFHFDPAARVHRERIAGFLRAGAALVFLLVAAVVLFFLRRERRGRRRP